MTAKHFTHTDPTFTRYRPQQFNVILDTGSSDLWLAGAQCTSCPSGTPEFDTSKSSSFTSTGNQEVTIQYGSGAVTGTLAQDSVSMGAFSVSQQTFRKYSPFRLLRDQHCTPHSQCTTDNKFSSFWQCRRHHGSRIPITCLN